MISFDVIPPPDGARNLGAVTIDSDGNKWCGFDGGFAKYDGNSWELFTTNNSPLPNEWVTSIVIDTLGNKWLGTYGGGIAIFNENGVVTSIKTNSTFAEDKYLLEQNYPNPFNPITTISYYIPEDSPVKLDVFDILGNKLSTLVNGTKKEGYYSLQFDAKSLSSGIYFYRLQGKDFVSTKKLILLK